MSKRSQTEIVTPDVPSPPSADPAGPVVHESTGSEPTIAELLAGGDAVRDAAFVRTAKESLGPAIALAKAGIPRYRRYLEEAEGLLQRAKVLDLQRLVGLGCPQQTLLWPLEQFHARVKGIPRAIADAQRGLDAVDTLSPAECRRTTGEASVNQWPPRVEYVRLLLMAAGAGEDRLQTDIGALREYVGRVEGWVRGHLVQHGHTAPTMAKEPLRPEPGGTILAFDAFKVP